MNARPITVFSAVLALCVSVAQAGILTSGNTFLDEIVVGQLDATDNWVVITSDAVSQSMIDDFVSGTDSPAFDTSSDLTFLYQLSNNGGGTDAVEALRQMYEGNTTSWGYFAGWGFTDAGTAIGINQNMGVDTWPDGGGSMRYGGTPGFVKNTGAYVDPSSTTNIEISGNIGNIRWSFDPALGAESDVSSILVSTAKNGNLKWLPKEEAVSVGDRVCTGDNPNGPEPGTLSLLALGALALMRRRRRT